jgi:hypothetical protein
LSPSEKQGILERDGKSHLISELVSRESRVAKLTNLKNLSGFVFRGSIWERLSLDFQPITQSHAHLLTHVKTCTQK